MKKIALFTALTLVFMTANCLAGVTFIVDSPQHTSRNSGGSGYHNTNPTAPTQPSPETICRSRGSNRNGCPSGQYGLIPCPESGNFYKYCCPEENRYTPEECEQQGMVAVGGGCHGLYTCN